MQANNLESLITTGKQYVPFKPCVNLNKLIHGFKKLTELPQQARKQWEFWLPNKQEDEPDSGLLEKRVEDGKDPKFFFHCRPILLEQLANSEADYLPHLPFIQQANKLYRQLEDKAEKLIIQLDHELPGYNFLQRFHAVPEATRLTLRMLLYKPGYEIMAQPHHDRSFITFAVSESRNGLRFADNHQLYEPVKNHMLAFTGLKARLATNSVLKSNFHYVHNELMAKWRWAIVYFIHIKVDATEDEIHKLVKIP